MVVHYEPGARDEVCGQAAFGFVIRTTSASLQHHTRLRSITHSAPYNLSMQVLKVLNDEGWVLDVDIPEGNAIAVELRRGLGRSVSSPSKLSGKL